MVLSAFETFMSLLASHRIYNNFIVGAQYKPLLTTKKITNAVTKMCTKYPQFSLTVGRGHHSEYLPKYDVKDCIDVIDDSNPKQILEKYTALKFSYADKVPLWKLVLDSKSNTLFFVADHTYLDGTAIKNVYGEICKSLDNGNDEDIKTSVIEPDFPPYPTSAEMMKFEDTLAEYDPEKGSSPEMDQELLKLPNYKHNYEVVHLTREKTKYLIKLCRDNGFRITSLMYAIATKAITDSYVHSGEIDKLRTIIAVNTRFKIGSEVDEILYQLGLFFGVHSHYDDISYVQKANVIEMAKNFHNGLNDRKDECNEIWEILETKSKRDRSAIDSEIAKWKSRDSDPLSTLFISNINVIGDEKIGKVYFDQPMFDAAFSCHLVSSYDGMALNFTSHRAIPKEIYEKYIARSLHYIDSI